MISFGIILGITGAFLAAINRAYAANCVWSISSIWLACRAYGLGDSSSVLLFGVYEVIALYGVYRHIRDSHKSSFLTVRLLNQNIYITSTRCIS